MSAPRSMRPSSTSCRAVKAVTTLDREAIRNTASRGAPCTATATTLPSRTTAAATAPPRATSADRSRVVAEASRAAAASVTGSTLYQQALPEDDPLAGRGGLHLPGSPAPRLHDAEGHEPEDAPDPVDHGGPRLLDSAR